jgi:hypothetical protein
MHAVPVGHVTAAQGLLAWSGTHAQTLGELSKCEPTVHSTFSTHWQMPPQSAPPFAGSQPSFGSSTHLPAPGHAIPAIPPQDTLGQAPLSATETPAAAASQALPYVAPLQPQTGS